MFLGQESGSAQPTSGSVSASSDGSCMEKFQNAIPQGLKDNYLMITSACWLFLQLMAVGLCLSGWVLAGDLSSSFKGMKFEIVWTTFCVIAFAVYTVLVFLKVLTNSLYAHAITVTSLVALIQINLIGLAIWSDAEGSKKADAFVAFNSLYFVAALVMITVLLMFRDLLFGEGGRHVEAGASALAQEEGQALHPQP